MENESEPPELKTISAVLQQGSTAYTKPVSFS